MLRLTGVVEVNGGKKKEDVVVADSRGVARVVRWEQDIGCLEAGKCYVLAGTVVRSFASEMYLSMSKEGYSVKECGDIGEVVEEEEETVRLDGRWKWTNAVVYGVEALSTYESCVKCNGKVMVDVDKPRLGRCGNCNMLQQTQMQTWSARLVINPLPTKDANTRHDASTPV